MEDKYCWWSNHCSKHSKDYLCCHFCPDRDKQGCEYACCDDLKECKYRCDIPGDLAFKRLREKELSEFYAEQEAKKQKVSNNKSNNEKLYKISEVAKDLNVVYDFIYNKVKSGEISGVKQGSRYFITQIEYNRIRGKYNGK